MVQPKMIIRYEKKTIIKMLTFSFLNLMLVQLYIQVDQLYPELIYPISNIETKLITKIPHSNLQRKFYSNKVSQPLVQTIFFSNF